MSTETGGGVMFANLRGLDVESIEVQQPADEIVYLYISIQGADGKFSLVLSQEQAVELFQQLDSPNKDK